MRRLLLIVLILNASFIYADLFSTYITYSISAEDAFSDPRPSHFISHEFWVDGFSGYMVQMVGYGLKYNPVSKATLCVNYGYALFPIVGNGVLGVLRANFLFNTESNAFGIAPEFEICLFGDILTLSMFSRYNMFKNEGNTLEIGLKIGIIGFLGMAMMF